MIMTNVSGPINAIRLEGKIAGTKKVLYLFADVSVALYQETQCIDPLSVDISNYLFTQLKESKNNGIKYDLFMPMSLKIVGP